MFEEKIEIYKEIFFKYNKIHNISSFESLDEEIKDSLRPLEFLDFLGFKSVADIGSGAGFPALFLALKLPQINFFLYEPNHKKAAFLSLIKARLNIKNIEVKCMRVEQEEALKAGLITSRALMKSKDLIKICENIIKLDTKMLLFKGSNAQNELEGLEFKSFDYLPRRYILINDLKERKC